MSTTSPETSVWSDKRGRQRALYPRQAQALQLYADGLKIAQIAEEMEIAVGTARSYVGAASAALGAESPTDAVKIAQERGEIERPGQRRDVPGS
jgi:DNA-binding NarL/FixJ family response regulator